MYSCEPYPTVGTFPTQKPMEMATNGSPCTKLLRKSGSHEHRGACSIHWVSLMLAPCPNGCRPREPQSVLPERGETASSRRPIYRIHNPRRRICELGPVAAGVALLSDEPVPTSLWCADVSSCMPRSGRAFATSRRWPQCSALVLWEGGRDALNDEALDRLVGLRDELMRRSTYTARVRQKGRSVGQSGPNSRRFASASCRASIRNLLDCSADDPRRRCSSWFQAPAPLRVRPSASIAWTRQR